MKTPFEQWLQNVDSEIDALTGMSRDDLPDCCYRDWYDSGMSVGTAARKAIRNAKDF